jgi:hypothetical protein
MLNVRLVASIAAVGAGISFLTGVFSGIPLGTLLLRLVLVAIGSALFGAGVSYIVGRFVPDLVAPRPDASPEDAAVDAEAGAPENAEEIAIGTTVDISVGDEEAEPLDRDVGFQAQDAVADLGLAEGIGEEAPAARSPVRPPSVLDDLDVLPDLDGFAPSFQGDGAALDDSASEEPMAGAELPRSAPSRPSRANGVDSNPAEIAKAVRTLLQRDQKG